MINLPVAKNPDGSTITGPAYEYIVMGNATTQTYTLNYKAATLDKTKATLTNRAAPERRADGHSRQRLGL